MTLSTHEHALFVAGTRHDVTGGEVVLDESWAPYAQARVTIPLPPPEVLAALDPRRYPRVRLTSAARFGQPAPLSDLTDSYSGRPLSALTNGAPPDPGPITRTNLAHDPRATAKNLAAAQAVGWQPRWFGAGGAGTTETITGATDGPEGITSYIRNTWTTAPTGTSGDTGFDHTGGCGTGAATGAAGLIVSPGETYTVSSHMRASRAIGPAIHFHVAFRLRDAAGALVSSLVGPNTPVIGGAWQQVSATITIPAGVYRLCVYTDHDTGNDFPANRWAPVDTLDGTGLLVEKVAAVGPYFDGSTAESGSRVYSWTSAANASQSVERLVTSDPGLPAYGGVPLRRLSADLSAPLNDGGHRDSQTITLDLVITRREVDRLTGEVTLDLASDEALALDTCALANVSPGSSTVRAGIALALASIGATLTPGTVDGSVAPAAMRWSVGQSAWDYMLSLAQSAGLRVWCDERRVWRLERPLTGADAVGSITVNAPTSTQLREVSSREQWATGVVVTYRWTDDVTGSQVQHDVAGTPTRVVRIDRDSPWPGAGAAAAILARLRSRGRADEVERVSDYTVRPGWVMLTRHEAETIQAGIVSRVRHDLATDEMTVTSRDLDDAGPRAWAVQPLGHRWQDTPTGTTWTTYTTPEGA